MDPVTLIVIPGFLGGLVIALVVFLRQRRGSNPPSLGAPTGNERLSTDIINASSIKVAGVGGLGLVAMAAAVALNVPRIGQTIGMGLVLGLVLATIMIVRRRRTGSMPSSGEQPGANSTLAINAAVQREGGGDQAPTGPMDLVSTRA